MGRQLWRLCQVEARGEPRSPASQLWPSNSARCPQGPCLQERRPGVSPEGQNVPSGFEFLLKLTQVTWALMTAPDWKQA